LFVGRSTLNSSLLNTHFEVNYRRWWRGWGEREKAKKKRSRSGNSSRRYKPCWAFVTVNKTNCRFEFACELPRSDISRSMTIVFFRINPFGPPSLRLLRATLTRGCCFPFEIMVRTKNRCFCAKVNDSWKNCRCKRLARN